VSASRHLVVGVDGSVASDLALRWALGQAACTGADVDVVAAWHWRPLQGTVVAATTAESVREWTERMVGEVVADARAAYPEIPVTVTVIEGEAAGVLTHAAMDGDLIVLGSHRHGRVHRAALGSTVDACVRRAPCPVVVIPASVRIPVARASRAARPRPVAVTGVSPAGAVAGLLAPRDVVTLTAPPSKGDTR
jgi:nucleotide-binding universal stress UspA family protein